MGSVGEDPAVLQLDLQDFSSRNLGCLVERTRLFTAVTDGEVGSDSGKEVLSGQKARLLLGFPRRRRFG